MAEAKQGDSCPPGCEEGSSDVEILSSDGETEQEDSDEDYDYEYNYYEEEFCYMESVSKSTVSPMFLQDVETFTKVLLGDEKQTLGDEKQAEGELLAAGGEDGKNGSDTSAGSDANVLDIRYRILDELAECDCSIFIPMDKLGLSPVVAKAWRLNWDTPLVIHLSLNSRLYMDFAAIPAVQVDQKNPSKDCGIYLQLTSILKKYLSDCWPLFSNKFLESSMNPTSAESADMEEACAGAEKPDDGCLLCAHDSTTSPIEYLPADRSTPTNSTDPTPTNSADPTPTNSANPAQSAEALDERKSTLSRSLSEGFFVMLYRYICQRFPSLNDHCAICDQILKDRYMLMPSVCTRELCLFSFEELGVMANAASGIATDAEVIDLLVRMAIAASSSHRSAAIFTPFPNIVDPVDPASWALCDKTRNIEKAMGLLFRMPKMRELAKYNSSELPDVLNKMDPLYYPLLSWIIYSNRSHLVKLAAEKQLEFMATPYQFLLLSSPPKHERQFQKDKAKYGSLFAFHGSPFENWHSIIRTGLIVGSGTRLMLNGARYGKGIYLSFNFERSFIYSTQDQRPPFCYEKGVVKNETESDRRFLPHCQLRCISLCEVIKSPDLKNAGGGILVLSNKAHVSTRFFCVYPGNQPVPDIDISKKKYIRQLQKALQSEYQPALDRTLLTRTTEVNKLLNKKI